MVVHPRWCARVGHRQVYGPRSPQGDRGPLIYGGRGRGPAIGGPGRSARRAAYDPPDMALHPGLMAGRSLPSAGRRRRSSASGREFAQRDARARKLAETFFDLGVLTGGRIA